MPSSNEPILTIDVPGRAVSANARLTYDRKSGRPVLTRAAREWRQTVESFAWAEMMDRRADQTWRLPIMPLRIVCHIYGTRADADNLAKLILDGLKEGIGVDDSQYKTVEMHATAKGMKQPHTVIEVYEAEAEQAA